MVEQKKQCKRGMSMVEILVVIGLISMLLIGAMSMLSSAVRVQSETLARQSMLDQASYVLDIMTKELRMARKDYDIECNVWSPSPLDSSGVTSSTFGTKDIIDSNGDVNSEIWFYSQEIGKCFDIKYDPASSTVKIGAFSTSSIKQNSPTPGSSLMPGSHCPYFHKTPTDSQGNIDSAKCSENFNKGFVSLFSDDIIVERFLVTQKQQIVASQPMVTILMRLRHKVKKSLPPVDIQTTVSARNINWTQNK